MIRKYARLFSVFFLNCFSEKQQVTKKFEIDVYIYKIFEQQRVYIKNHFLPFNMHKKGILSFVFSPSSSLVHSFTLSIKFLVSWKKIAVMMVRGAQVDEICLNFLLFFKNVLMSF